MVYYPNNVSYIDLSSGRSEMKEIEEEEARRFLLGSGWAAHRFYRDVSPEWRPFDPRSPLYIAIGLLTGTIVPTACRAVFCGRSPLTGIWCESTVGGYWGAQLRRTGYGAVVIRGQSSQPVYLWLQEERIELRPADQLWGLDTYETVERLAQLHPGAQVACIGPAGEKCSAMANVMVGGAESRAAGRGGMGALMGAKRLKAIVVQGGNRPSYWDLEGLKESIRRANREIRDRTLSMNRFGTSGGVITTEKVGDMPIKNWLLGSWKERAIRITGETMAERFKTGNYRCHACPIACGQEIRIAEGIYAGVCGSAPEYETVMGFGPLCLNDDLASIAAMNQLCNQMGLDTISTSSTVAFALEAYEKGLISPRETHGLELRWGDAKAMLNLIELIARREGIGELLADGTRAAADKLGTLAIEFAVHTKGLEIPYHDPRAFTSMAVAYATGNRGGCHLETMTYWHEYGLKWPDLGYNDAPDMYSSENKAKMVYDFQNFMGLFNGLGICKFSAKGGVGPQLLADWVNLSLGWNWDPVEALMVGERLFNVKRLINSRWGISRKDDMLPPRLYAHTRPSGQAQGNLPHLGMMLHQYYQLRGWSEDGMPTQERLEELGLS